MARARVFVCSLLSRFVNAFPRVVRDRRAIASPATRRGGGDGARPPDRPQESAAVGAGSREFMKNEWLREFEITPETIEWLRGDDVNQGPPHHLVRRAATTDVAQEARRVDVEARMHAPGPIWVAVSPLVLSQTGQNGNKIPITAK